MPSVLYPQSHRLTKWLLLVILKSNVAFRLILVLTYNMTKLQSNVVQRKVFGAIRTVSRLALVVNVSSVGVP